MKVKKLLSIILSISYIFSSIIPVQVFAEDYCAAKNSKGGYLHPRCSNPELVKVGNNQADYVSVENLGPFGDEERYCFNFRALDDVYEKKKLISVKKLREERNSLDKACEAPFLNLSTGLKIGLTSLLGAIGGYFLPKSTKNIKPQSSGSNSAKNTPKSSPQTSPSPSFDDLTLKEYKPRRGVFPVCIGALISGLVSLIGLCVNYNVNKSNACKKSDELTRRIVEINGANERKADMLNLLLHAIDRPQSLTFDMVCFISQPNNFYWDPKYVGINYTKAELASFPEKFKEIAAKIRKNLEETGYLTPDNEIRGKAVNPEQRELSD